MNNISYFKFPAISNNIAGAFNLWNGRNTSATLQYIIASYAIFSNGICF